MASVPAIIDKGSSYIMESLGFSLRSERWKARELGHWKWRKKRGIGEEGPLFLFALFFLSLSRGFFAPALKAIEFAQYSFTVHNVSTQQGCCLLEPWISPTIPSTLELYGKKLHVNLRTYVGRTSLVFLRKLRRSFAEKWWIVFSLRNAVLMRFVNLGYTLQNRR